MLLKSGLRSTVREVLEEHEIDDASLEEDLVDRLVQDFGDEVLDDEEDDEGTLGEDE